MEAVEIVSDAEFDRRFGVLDGVDGSQYNGVWKLWKVGSLGLFAVFVAAMIDCARTLRKIERHQPERN